MCFVALRLLFQSTCHSHKVFARKCTCKTIHSFNQIISELHQAPVGCGLQMAAETTFEIMKCKRQQQSNNDLRMHEFEVLKHLILFRTSSSLSGGDGHRTHDPSILTTSCHGNLVALSDTAKHGHGDEIAAPQRQY